MLVLRSMKARGRSSVFSSFKESWKTLVGPSGLEPPTSCLSGTRSNLLSYEPMWLVKWFLSLVPCVTFTKWRFHFSTCRKISLVYEFHFWRSQKFHCKPKACSGGDDGIRSHCELRSLVAVGRKRPPEVCSVPPLFESLRNMEPRGSVFRGTREVPWWRWWDSNPWPPACRAGALPTELHPR